MLSDRLTDDLKAAMRAKDAVRLRTIRSLRAALQQKEIEERTEGKATLTEDQELAVVQKQAKQRRDAIEQYEAAGRDDLVQKEQEELDLIETYLPQQLSEADVRREVETIIVAVGASGPQDMGRVMGEAMKRLRGRTDGRTVQHVATQLLRDRSA